MKNSVVILSMLFATSAMSDVAYSQDNPSLFDRNANVSVKERFRPAYDTQGVQRGGFFYSPELLAQIEFDNNVFASEINEISDVVGVLAPSIGMESTWAVHAFEAEAGLEQREYFDYSSESVTNYGLSADGRLDATSNTAIGAGTSYRKSHEDRTAAGAIVRSIEPVEYDVFDGYLSATHETGRTQFSALVGFADYDYDDVGLTIGGFADQDFRDRNQLNLEGRAAYAISPATAIFARVRYIDQDFDNVIAPAVERDQDGYTIDVGADFDITNSMRGQVGVGYTERSFDSLGFDKVDGFSFGGNIEWFPTPLVTLGLSADRGFRVSSLANSPAYEEVAFSGFADYEFRRNIIFSAGGSYSDEDYAIIDRQDDRVSGFVGVEYFMNRYVGFSANAVRSSLGSEGLNRRGDADNTKFIFGLTLRR